MCKNLFIAGIKPKFANPKSEINVWDFLMTASPFMAAGDRDGLGYVALGEQGLWGERWLRPEDSWNYRKEWTKDDDLVVENFNGTVVGLHGPKYNSFGIASPSTTTSVMLHARFATCEKSMANVHPFVLGETGLIHNGQIRNHEKLKKVLSTCDSEVILHEYIEKNVATNPNAIQEVVKTIEGYYCCGILSRAEADGKIQYYLDIWRSYGAQLYAYYVYPLETLVFCTSDKIIRETCNKLDWKYGSTMKFQDDLMLRMNAITGEYISEHKYTTWSQGNWNGRYSQYNTGHEHSYCSNDNEKKSSLLTKNSSKCGTDTAGTLIDNVRAFADRVKDTRDPIIIGEIKEKLKDPFYVEGEGYYNEH